MSENISSAQLESSIKTALDSLGIVPYSVVLSDAFGADLLSVSFYTPPDFDQFVDFLGYKDMCDKSGILPIRDHGTVLIGALGLVKFLRKLGNDNY